MIFEAALAIFAQAYFTASCCDTKCRQGALREPWNAHKGKL
ncbi:MAG: hypothetical protein JWR80_7061 [Bradyrhizobium sp.]|nr:hypothetical protein [Bradyrhizobium sp.]